MDGFWCSRCLNKCIDLLYMIGSFASGANVSLVAKNGTKKIIPLLSIKSSPVDRFQSLRCLNYHIDLPYMMGLLAIGATNSLVAKIGTKDFATSCSVYRFWTNGQILMLKVSENCIDLPYMMGSLASGATNSRVAKIGTKDLATSCWVYKISNNGRILMFKVSKWPYQSPRHDRIICKWHHCLHSGQKSN